MNRGMKDGGEAGRPEKTLFAWSSGKDSAMALYELMTGGRYEVAALLTTLTEDFDRISMHGVRRALVEEQAEALGLPLEKVFIPAGSSNDRYEANMRDALDRYARRGVSSVAFGDIFLEDLKRYREDRLSKAGMKGVFPLWKKESSALARSFIDRGFRAVITCVDSDQLDGSFAGRQFDEQFLRDLPPSVDPCGENGEFHSFVYDGPIFRRSIGYVRGDVVLRDSRFYFCDISPRS